MKYYQNNQIERAIITIENAIKVLNICIVREANVQIKEKLLKVKP